MRAFIVGFAAVAGLAFASLPTSALPRSGIGMAAGPVPAIEKVAEGCGVGWHWVAGYRDSYGVWHRGRCERNRP